MKMLRELNGTLLANTDLHVLGHAYKYLATILALATRSQPACFTNPGHACGKFIEFIRHATCKSYLS